MDSFRQMPNRTSPGFRRRKPRLGWFAVGTLGVLLVVPIYALSRSTARADWWVWLIVPLTISGLAFFVYRSDKKRAEAGDWRVSEGTLHFLSLIGGWPGAFLGQRVFRHKTSKRWFQFVFWSIVAVHEFLAVDSLQNWRLSSDAFHFVQQQIGSQSGRRR